MKSALVNFLEKKSVLTPSQFGFRRGFRTFDALRTFSEEIYKSLDSQNSLLSIYVDFTKAFDTVNHNFLLQKLNFYGIRGVINDWFQDYLNNRTQSTRYNNHISNPQCIKYGVPQGSVLGPILFLIYINDLPNIFTKLKTILFADDSSLYLSGTETTTMINSANEDLQVFHKWCITNRLTVNLDKTFYMLFTNKPPHPLPPLIYHNNIIKRTSHHTLLGITFDDCMTFKPHISSLIIKLSRIVSLLFQIRSFMPNNILITMYNAHVLPHLLYCSPIWCNTYPTHLLPLFRLQKKIIRIINKSDFLAHTQTLFKQCNILKIFDLNKLQIGIHMFTAVNTTHHTHLQSQHTYPTRTRAHLRTPLHNLTIFQHSLSYSGPKIWNSIPYHIQNLSTTLSFKKQYKKHLLAQY